MLQGVIAGKGGGGVITVNSMLGHLAMELGHTVISAETHGMAMRGGSVSTSIKIGDFKSPSIASGACHFILSLDSDEAVRNIRFLREMGLCIVNGSGPGPSLPPGKFRVETIDAVRLATERFNRPILASQIMIGRLVEAFPVVFPRSESLAILEKIPRANMDAIKAGIFFE